MRFYIVIPAHNEEDCINYTLDSLIKQSFLPKKIVVVNDNSTDSTASIVSKYSKKYPWIILINSHSSAKHMPGSKVINAFYKGYETLDNNYDVMCKFDGDLIFPSNYLETLKTHFEQDKTIGMVGGFCYIKKQSSWVLENLTRKDHIRGALKAYRKPCFEAIGALKKEMGWDTVDELLAKYYNWKVITDTNLKVKHLKPTGATYHKTSRYLQGEALYKMRLGFTLTLLSALKSAINKNSLSYFIDTLKGFFKAKKEKLTPLVSTDQGFFIRQLRWKGIKETLGL